MTEVRHGDPELEQTILSCVLVDETCYDRVADELGPDDFVSPRLGRMWTAMQRIRARGDRIDPLTLRAELLTCGEFQQAGGDEALETLTTSIPNVDAVESYAQHVIQLAHVRSILQVAQRIEARGRTPRQVWRPHAPPATQELRDFVEQAEGDLHAAITRRGVGQRGAGIGQVIEEAVEALSARTASGGVEGLSTGLQALDARIGGLRGGHLVIAAGRPGMGKSALGGQLARAAAGVGSPAAIYSLEMTRREWGERLLLAEGRVDNERARAGRLSREQWTAATAAANRLHGLPIQVDDTPSLSIPALRSKARRAQAQMGGLGLIVVDYVQLMRSGERHGSREEEVAAISRNLKSLAKELDVAVVALAQLNRGVENRPNKRPMLSDLRESGQLEQDADVVLGLYRPAYYYDRATAKRDEPRPHRTDAEIIVCKQRNGPPGTAKVRFFGEWFRFGDRARTYDEDPETNRGRT